MDNKKVVVFDYSEGWMILLYEDIKQIKYWCGDEHSWDNVWEYIDVIRKYEEVEIIKPKLKTYDDVRNLNIDIFELLEEDFDKLRQLSL